MRDRFGGFALWIVTGFRAAPRVMTWGLLGSSIGGLLPPLEAYAVKLVVDGITRHDSAPLTGAAAIFAASLLYTFLYRSTMGPPIGATTRDRVHGYLHADLLRVTTGIPTITHHETSSVADRIELLHRQAWDMAFNVLTFYGILISSTIGAIAIVVLLADASPILLALPLFALIRVWAGTIEGRINADALECTAPHTRRIDLLAEAAANPRAGLETRVFGLRTPLMRQIDDLLEAVEVIRIAARRRAAAYQLAARLAYGIAYAAAIMLVVAKSSATPGDIALVVLLGARVEQATTQLVTASEGAGSTIRMFTRYAWLRRYARESSRSDATASPPARLRTGIALRGIGFAYPGADRPVLSDIDIELPAGSTVALVGENGAGKTTLVNVLAGLHEPTAGAVLIDGRDLRELDPHAWRERCSAAYQDYVRYELTAGEAVGVGDLHHLDDAATIAAAVERGDATDIISRLPHGLRTQLGTRFADGVDLSGGQWQRLALARGFMRVDPLLLVLDEPTAALDPESEHALFQRFAAASHATARRTGGVTVLVSHRFSTVRMADLIVVLHQGRIVETGSHEQLLDRHGRYAELYALQAGMYR